METFVEVLDGASVLGTLAAIALIACLLPLRTLIHEGGHALAALAVGCPISEVVVGDDRPLLAVRGEHVRLRLGAITGRGGRAGYVTFDGSRAKPREVLLIALAGPLASLAGGLAFGLLAFWTWSEPLLTFASMMGAVAGWSSFVDNLRVFGDGPGTWSDGVWVRAAWRAMRRPSVRPPELLHDPRVTGPGVPDPVRDA